MRADGPRGTPPADRTAPVRHRDGRLRLFVAGDLPADVLDGIRRWQADALSGHDEVRVNHALHLTLSFLGDTDAAMVPRLVEALTEVRWAPCATSLGAVLFLPRRGRRNVVAVALEDPDRALTALQGEVSRALVSTGLHDVEKRPWLPHVTVARFRRPGQPFSLQNVTMPGFCVVRMALYSSSLESAGAVHTPLAVFPASQ